MAGRPRTRRARSIAEQVIGQLERGRWPAYRLDWLLARTLHGSEHWPDMARWEHAALHMALRELSADPRVVQIGGLVTFCPWNAPEETT